MNVTQAPTKHDLPKRETPVRAIIVHTTGDNNLQKILAYYQSTDGLQPHYVIGIDGIIYQVADERLIAYHCKIDKQEAIHYRMGWSHWCRWVWQNDRPVETSQEFAGYVEWRDTWRRLGYQSPLELVTVDRPNSYSIGVELQQPVKPVAGQIFTEPQYQSLAELLNDIGERHDIKLDRGTLLGHSDVSPMRRCNASGPWDPGAQTNWNKIFDLLRQIDKKTYAAGMIGKNGK